MSKSIQDCSLYMYGEDSVRIFKDKRTGEVLFALDDVARALDHDSAQEMTKFWRKEDEQEIRLVVADKEYPFSCKVKCLTMLGVAHAVLNRVQVQVNTSKEINNASYFWAWIQDKLVRVSTYEPC